MIKSMNIIREVYGIWNNPAYTRLDPKKVIAALNRVWSQRKLDLGLSGGSFLVKVSEPFYINETREIALADSGASVDESFTEARVERRSADSIKAEDWEQVYTGTFADWTSFKNQTRAYAAFYGSADEPVMIINHDPEKFVYRLFYEPVGNLDGALSAPGEIELPALFQALLTYDTAIEAGMLIDDRSQEFLNDRSEKLRLFLMPRQVDALARFERWLTSRKPQSSTTRVAFNDRTKQIGLGVKSGGENYIISIN